MASYQITGPGGATYQVDGPDNALPPIDAARATIAKAQSLPVGPTLAASANTAPSSGPFDTSAAASAQATQAKPATSQPYNYKVGAVNAAGPSGINESSNV